MWPKDIDHLPLFQQGGIFARADLAIVRTTTAKWVGSVGGPLSASTDSKPSSKISIPTNDGDVDSKLKTSRRNAHR